MEQFDFKFVAIGHVIFGLHYLLDIDDAQQEQNRVIAPEIVIESCGEYQFS